MKPVANEHNSDSPINSVPSQDLQPRRPWSVGQEGRNLKPSPRLPSYGRSFFSRKTTSEAKTGCSEALEGFVGGTGTAELKACGAGLVRVALCMPLWWWRCYSVNVDFFGASLTHTT